MDHFPAWSPDGSRIAFVGLSGDNEDVDIERQVLYTMATDGSDVRLIAGRVRLPTGGWSDSDIRGVAFLPPVWSPDSQWVAFYALEGESEADGNILYIARSHAIYVARRDGSEIRRIGGKVTLADEQQYPPLPSWSPDGSRIAFAMGNGSNGGVFTARLDGTDVREVANGFDVRELSWSPDGSEILFLADGPYFWPHLVRPDGSNLRRLQMPSGLIRRIAESRSTALTVWSPDSSRIALYYPGHLLVSMDRDGTHNRILLAGDAHSVWWLSRDRRPIERPGLSACSEGIVVPEPALNPGLVRDCEILLTSVEVLAGSFPFRWSPDVPITQWERVVVGGTPSRVREVNLEDKGLTGRIPAALGQLSELRRLDLSDNALIGQIPPELGGLAELIILRIESTYISGPIPPELGALTNLQWLNLNGGSLSGSIPPELAALSSLRKLDISDNRLTGCIRSGFSEIWVAGSGLDRCQSV